MDLTQYQSTLLEMLATHEELISNLYKIYAGKIISHNDFWSKIAAEEIEHAQWIRNLQEKIKENLVLFKEGRFSKWVVQSSLDYTQKKIIEAQNNPITAVEALNTALERERSMIESKVFEIFKSDAKELEIVLAALSAGTQDHIERLQEALNEV